LAAALCLLPAVCWGQIIGAQKLFGRYQQFVWQDQHGLPQNGISEIAQTPDGYLWLAIAEGVTRFDGVRFTAFDTGNTPELKSNNVQALFAGRDGSLWIGTHGGGLTRYLSGKFTHYSAAEGLSAPFIRCIFEDSRGNLWVGTDGAGLNLWRDGRFTVFTTQDGLPENHIGALNEDAEGALWVGTTNGLARLKDGKFTTFTTKDGLNGNNLRKIFRDGSGQLWTGGPDGLNVWRDGRFAATDMPRAEVRSIVQDRDGALWIGTIGDGLFRFKDGRFTSAATREGLISNELQALFADAQGDIWLGTNGGGLAQLKRGRFTTYTTDDGLPDNIIHAIYEDRDGGVWVGADEGLARFKDGKFTVVTRPDGLSPRHVNGIHQDREGKLWIKSRSGDMALRYREGSATVEVVRDQIFDNRASVSLEDRAGNLWYGASADGLHRVARDGRETVFHRADGLADEYVNALYEDRNGVVWVGTRSGLSRFKDGALQNAAQEGFTGGHVQSFHEDRDGTLWIGTHGDGLFRFRDGKFTNVTAKQGLYDNLAFAILEDDAGNLWMSGNKGIYRASLAELNEVADGRRATLNSFSYGSLDGMLSRECNGANPAGARTRDGRLWFPTIKGVVVVEPKTSAAKPPLVALEQVLVDNQKLPAEQRIDIQPGQSDLEIRFTALNWNRPAQTRFRYQLAGLDAGWVEAGERRTAFYAHLPPGDYAFRVIADNGEGVWNEAGPSLAVKVLPPFYLTAWFRFLAVSGSLVLVWVAVQRRVRRVEKQRRAQAEFSRQLLVSQEHERQRIAAALHDSLGQSLLIIKNRVSLAQLDIEDREIVAEQLDELMQSASAAIEECREIAYNLQPYQIKRFGLTKTLTGLFHRLDEVTPIETSVEIDNIDDALGEEGQTNIFRIVQECVNNIIKHSQATAAAFTLKRHAHHLELMVRDNGRGLKLEKQSEKPPAKGGFGLIGMAERVKMLGGEFSIASDPGTVIRIRLPLSPGV
jgi:ligand-binding sensor domain-containing protein/two-component sensor histidine kinase